MLISKVHKCKGCVSKTSQGCEILNPEPDGLCPFYKTFKEEQEELYMCYMRIREAGKFRSFGEYLKCLDENMTSGRAYFIKFLKGYEGR